MPEPPSLRKAKQFFDQLADQSWIKRTERRWWPKFVFHYTDVRNAVQILEQGCLFSRKRLEDAGNLPVSSGSPDVLSGTDTKAKEGVRLYFRPKTPTQYHVEGIRSKRTLNSSKYPQAHCPVPVFFLFDSAQILARPDCRFSNGNLASLRHKTFKSVQSLQKLPWKKIYHTGSYRNRTQSNIPFHRNAEAFVPDKLDLSPALKYIFCRSEPEKETLLHQLKPGARRRFQNIVQSSARSNLFYRQHTYLETVRLSPSETTFHFSPDTSSHGPFDLMIEVESKSHPPQTFQESEYIVSSPLRIGFIRRHSDYTVRLQLDEHLTYANNFEEVELPF